MVECWFEGKLSYWAIISEARLVRVVPGSLTLPAARQPWTVWLLQDNSYHTGPLGPLTVTSHCPRLSRPTFPMTDGVSCSPLKSSLYPLVFPGVPWCPLELPSGCTDTCTCASLPLPLSWDSAGGESTQWRHTVATSQLPVSGSMSIYKPSTTIFCKWHWYWIVEVTLTTIITLSAQYIFTITRQSYLQQRCRVSRDSLWKDLTVMSSWWKYLAN